MSMRSAMFRRTVFFLVVLALAGLGGERVVADPRVVADVGREVEQGGRDTITIDLEIPDGETAAITSFDLLLSFDPTAVTFLSATAGSAVFAAGWEVFGYAAGSASECGGEPCPPHMIRVIGAASSEMQPGDAGDPITASGELATLAFETKSADTLQCRYLPVEFVWYSCSDNVLASDLHGDTLLASDEIFEYGWSNDISQDADFPTRYGVPDLCLTGGASGETMTRGVDFRVGGFDFLCSDSIDDRGDVNMNGQANEVADHVLFSSRLVFGPSVFSIDPNRQTAATDVNANLTPLELNDWMYLLRIIVGDAYPFPAPPKAGAAATAVVTQQHSTSTIRIDYPDSLRAAYFIFGGETEANPAFGSHAAGWNFDSTYTRVLLATAGVDLATFPPTDTNRVVLGYTGEAPLLYAELAFDGLTSIPVTIVREGVPSCCVLRGDANNDARMNIVDVTALVAYLFGGSLPPPCPDQADVDGQGAPGAAVTVTDITYLVSHLFHGGAPPPPCPAAR